MEITNDTLITDQQLDISYSEVTIKKPDAVTFVVGDGTVELFLETDFFPLYIDGEKINLSMTYRADSELMVVQRVERGGDVFYGHGDVVAEEAVETFEMNTYQKHIAFLYLLGVVLNDN